jgi:hypothetical protein
MALHHTFETMDVCVYLYPAGSVKYRGGYRISS